jgi:hypothetical protein
MATPIPTEVDLSENQIIQWTEELTHLSLSHPLNPLNPLGIFSQPIPMSPFKPVNASGQWKNLHDLTEEELPPLPSLPLLPSLPFPPPFPSPLSAPPPPPGLFCPDLSLHINSPARDILSPWNLSNHDEFNELHRSQNPWKSMRIEKFKESMGTCTQAWKSTSVEKLKQTMNTRAPTCNEIKFDDWVEQRMGSMYIGTKTNFLPH